MTQPIVLKSLTLMRGNRILLRDLSFELPAQQLTVIMAENGSGKTTLLQTLAGLCTPFNGEIDYAGIQPHEIRYIGHQNGLWPTLTVAECCQYLATLYGYADAKAKQDQALALFNLQACADLLVAQCSAGQKRRLALSVLFLSPGKLWLLDEPWTALDSNAQALLWELLAKHLQSGGYACVTSHQPLALASEKQKDGIYVPHIQTLKLSTYQNNKIRSMHAN